MTVLLADWLRSRTPEQLTTILASRPDAAGPPAPRHLPDLAARLESPPSVVLAAWALPRPGWEALAVLRLLGPAGATAAAVAAWLGRPESDPAVATVLANLTDRALAWPDPPGYRVALPLRRLDSGPLGLGPPAATLLDNHTADRLRAIAKTLNLAAAGRKPELAARIAGRLGEAERIRTLVSGAPEATRDRLRKLAGSVPSPDERDWIGRSGGWYRPGAPDPAVTWASDRALLLPDPHGQALMPREVGVALRGPGWHAPFTPDRPEPPLVRVAQDAVEREAAAAGAGAVERLGSLLDAISAAPVAPLKTGGIGVRELRRLARATGLDEDVTRLGLELAYHADLVDPEPDPDGTGWLLPTDHYDTWVAAGPAERLAAVLPVWAVLPAAPLRPPAPGTKAPAALLRQADGPAVAAIRQHLLAALTALPAGAAVPGPSALVPLLAWAAPMVIDPLPDPDALVAAVWREAELVGAVAHGALTPLGRTLTAAASPEAAGDPEDLVAACRRLLPPAVAEAVFQADLTALVPGTPDGVLASLLNTAADRESRGSATTWRFTRDTVRRALDSGIDPDTLLARLSDRAVGGTLPQPLRYLITDVARTHGAVRVRAANCLLRVDDPALATELAAARALRKLELATVAPTVLASALPATETLAALRAAGYAPVAESADGTRRPEAPAPPRIRRPVPVQAPPPPPERAGSPVAAGDRPPEELPELAERLLAAPEPTAPTGPGAGPPRTLADLERELIERGFLPVCAGLDDEGEDPDGEEVEAHLAAYADQLSASERQLLAHAVETEHPVEITYHGTPGRPSRRVVEPLAVGEGNLLAWCHASDDERVFPLPRIAAVTPA